MCSPNVWPQRQRLTTTAAAKAKVTLHYNSASTVDVNQQRVREIVDGYNAGLREGALSTLNLSPAQLAFALNPIVLDKKSTANEREQMGAIIGGMLPYLLLMVCLTAAMYPAIDLGAGGCYSCWMYIEQTAGASAAPHVAGADA